MIDRVVAKSVSNFSSQYFTYIEEVFMTPFKTAGCGILAGNSSDDVGRIQNKS